LISPGGVCLSWVNWYSRWPGLDPTDEICSYCTTPPTDRRGKLKGQLDCHFDNQTMRASTISISPPPRRRRRILQHIPPQRSGVR
jgi:hypothetical protein